ncbi:hypothetical protein BSKO_06077 [Bryopsis sp. KO-2023]|nr:hypothetical protein BSKO_06077 [Bryopsis sp. KO-2023]
MASLLRCGRRVNPRLLTNFQFCPGCSRFNSSDSSGRGSGDADGGAGGNPFDKAAPGSGTPSAPDGVGRGKKSSFAERLGLNIPPKPVPPVEPVVDARDESLQSGSPPLSGDAKAGTEPPSDQYPPDDRKVSRAPRKQVAKPEIIEGLGSQRKAAHHGETSPPPKPDVVKKEGREERVAQSPPPPPPPPVGKEIHQAAVQSHAASPPRVEQRDVVPPASSKPKVETQKKSPALSVKTKVESGRVAKVVIATSDDFLSELSPRKPPPKVEAKVADDWLDELSPKKTTKSVNDDWLDEFAPSPKKSAKPVFEEKKKATEAPPLPVEQAPELVKTLEVKIPVAASSVVESEPEPELKVELEPEKTHDKAEQLATTGEDMVKDTEEGEVMAAEEIQPDIAEVLPSDDQAVMDSAAPGESPELAAQTVEVEQTPKEEPAPQAEDTSSRGHSVFDAFLRKTAGQEQDSGPTLHPSEIRGEVPSTPEESKPGGAGISALLNFGQTQEGPPSTPSPFSPPPPPPPAAPQGPAVQGGSAQPDSQSRGSLMDRLGWGREEGSPSPYQQGPPSPGPQKVSPFGPVGPQGPGPAPQAALKSKLAERLGWTGDASEMDEEDRSRGRRKQPKRKPSATQAMYGRPRGPRQTEEDRHAKAFRSAKAMELALEGRLDEFDPNSYVDPDEVARERRRDFDDMDDGGDRGRRPSDRGLEIRMDQIPRTEWEGAPMNMDDYHIPDAYTQIGEHPSQHKVMDVERELNLELDPQYMVNFSQPSPWSALRRTVTPRQYLMRHKEDIMEQLRLCGSGATEEDFMEAAHIGLSDFKSWKKWMDSGKRFLGEGLIGNVKLEEEFIQHLVDSKVAKDHPMYSHLRQSAHALEHNAAWSFAKKAQFITRMVNNALKEV